MHIQIEGNLCSGKGLFLTHLQRKYEQKESELETNHIVNFRARDGKVHHFHHLPRISFLHIERSNAYLQNISNLSSAEIKSHLNIDLETMAADIDREMSTYDITISGKGICTVALSVATLISCDKLDRDDYQHFTKEMGYHKEILPVGIIYLTTPTEDCWTKYIQNHNFQTVDDPAFMERFIKEYDHEMHRFMVGWLSNKCFTIRCKDIHQAEYEYFLLDIIKYYNQHKYTVLNKL
jgi:hypothetical protein